MAGLLNSSVANFYVKQISSIFPGGYFSYGDQFIKWLPVPEADPEDQERLSDLSKELVRLSKALAELEGDLANFPESLTEKLSRQGKAPPRDTLGNLASGGGLAKVLKAENVAVETDLQGQTVLRLGRGSLTMPKTLARLVLEVLREQRSMKRDDLLALDFPIGPQDQRAYLDQLATWRAQRLRLQKEIGELEEEVDKVVYALFGLDSTEIEMAEKFLSRFSGD